MVAPTIRSSATSNRGTNATSDTITAPSSIVDGDILTLLYAKDASAAALTFPTGFTEITNTSEVNDGGQITRVGTKTASGESGNYTGTSSVAQEFAAWIGAIRDTSGIDDSIQAAEDPSTGSIEAGQVETTGPDRLILYLISSDDSTGTVTCTSDGGTTTLDKQQSQISGAFVACFYETQASAGLSTARTFTLNVSQEWVCRTVAFAPVESKGPPRIPRLGRIPILGR